MGRAHMVARLLEASASAPVKSIARTDALAELADNPTRNWEGTAVSYSLRTLQRHAARFDEGMKVGRMVDRTGARSVSS